MEGRELENAEKIPCLNLELLSDKVIYCMVLNWEERSDITNQFTLLN